MVEINTLRTAEPSKWTIQFQHVSSVRWHHYCKEFTVIAVVVRWHHYFILIENVATKKSMFICKENCTRMQI